MTRILAIDTASVQFALALLEEGELVANSVGATGEASRSLLAAIDNLTGGTLDNLAGLVVVRGPGSFAGLRVGLATAQGLALARGLPVAGVGTLQAVAWTLPPGRWNVVHPAGRGEFALQAYVDGESAGLVAVRPAAQLELPLAGEGAGALGGREVSPEQRCRAALEHGASLLAGDGPALEPLYAREPTITAPRSRMGGHTPAAT